MSAYRFFFCLIPFLLIPETAFAWRFDIFSSPDGDQSIYFLTMILGDVDRLEVSRLASTSLLPPLFHIMNVAILAIGMCIATYASIVSAVAGGEEGSPLAQKFGGKLAPLRITFGIAILVPFKGGYCLAQVLMFWIMTQGIGLANMMWGIVLQNYTSGYTMNAPMPAFQGVKITVQNLFRAAVCAAAANEDPGKFGLSESDYVQIYDPSPTSNKLYVGVPGSRQNKQICGAVTLTNLNSVASSNAQTSSVVDYNAQFISLQKAAFISVYGNYISPAEEAVRFPSTRWLFTNVLSNATTELNSFYTDIRSLSYVSPSITANQVAEDAYNDGWLYAGSFYNRLVSMSGTVNASFNTVPTFHIYTGTSFDSNNDKIPQAAYDYYAPKALAYLRKSEVSVTGGSASSNDKINTGSIRGVGHGNMPAIMETLFGDMFEKILELTETILTQSESAPGGAVSNDPLGSMATAGMNLLSIMEMAFLAALSVYIPMSFATYVMSGSQPAGFAFAIMSNFVMPLMLFFISLFVVAGIMIGIYIPMIPYMQYTFGTLNWLILVIEAFIAAPIIALGLVAPGSDKAGRAGHAVLITLNLFLRPALMVFGFIFSVRLLIVIMDFFNYTFGPTLASFTGSLGLFGSVTILILYANVLSILVNEVFQLIHILPDRVIRWIGGVAEQTAGRAAEMSQATKTMTESAANTAQTASVGAAKAVTEAVSEGVNEHRKKQKAKKELTGGEGPQNTKDAKKAVAAKKEEQEKAAKAAEEATAISDSAKKAADQGDKLLKDAKGSTEQAKEDAKKAEAAAKSAESALTAAQNGGDPTAVADAQVNLQAANSNVNSANQAVTSAQAHEQTVTDAQQKLRNKADEASSISTSTNDSLNSANSALSSAETRLSGLKKIESGMKASKEARAQQKEKDAERTDIAADLNAVSKQHSDSEGDTGGNVKGSQRIGDGRKKKKDK